MADNDNKKEEKRRSKWMRAWELIDEIILAGALYPLLKSLAVKGAEHIGKKVENKLFGDTVEESKKKVEDNVLYHWACSSGGLTAPEINDLLDFEVALRKEENGKDKVQALVLFVVKGIIMFKKDVKKTTGGKRNDEPKEETKEVDYSGGVAWAIKFLRQLLSFSTFAERVAFLEHEEVFSLIGKKKETIDLLQKVFDLSGKTKEAAMAGVEKVKAKYGQGIDNLNTNLGDLLTKAKAWRDRV